MSQPAPPVAPKIPHRIDQLGRTRTDDYAWMKDAAWHDRHETVDHAPHRL